MGYQNLSELDSKKEKIAKLLYVEFSGLERSE